MQWSLEDTTNLLVWAQAPHWGKSRKKSVLAKKTKSASEASQALVLPTTKLASLTAIFPISPLFSAFSPYYKACMVPGYHPLYTLQSSRKL